MSIDTFARRCSRKARLLAIATFFRATVLAATAVYLLTDPEGFGRMLLPILGGVLLADGILGFMSLDPDDEQQWRFVFGMIRYMLGIIAGVAIIGGLTVVRLAPEGALLHGLVSVLGIAGLLEIVPVLVFDRAAQHLPSLVGGSGLLLLGALPYLHHVVDVWTIVHLMAGVSFAFSAVLFARAFRFS